MPRDRILSIAAKPNGFQISAVAENDEALRARLNIFAARGILKVEQRGNLLTFKLTKDTYLL